jgi:glutamate racemase
VLTEAELLRTEPDEAAHVFTATGDPASFARLARRFLGPLLMAPAPAAG